MDAESITRDTEHAPKVSCPPLLVVCGDPLEVARLRPLGLSLAYANTAEVIRWLKASDFSQVLMCGCPELSRLVKIFCPSARLASPGALAACKSRREVIELFFQSEQHREEAA